MSIVLNKMIIILKKKSFISSYNFNNSNEIQITNTHSRHCSPARTRSSSATCPARRWGTTPATWFSARSSSSRTSSPPRSTCPWTTRGAYCAVLYISVWSRRTVSGELLFCFFFFIAYPGKSRVGRGTWETGVKILQLFTFRQFFRDI